MRLGVHRRACAQYNVAPDAERYLAGRNEGLKTFCTYERGYAQGRAGQTGGGYQLGRELYDLNRRLAEVQNQIARSKALLKDGIPSPRLRAAEVERLEDLTRESEQLEARIQGMTQR